MPARKHARLWKERERERERRERGERERRERKRVERLLAAKFCDAREIAQ